MPSSVTVSTSYISLHALLSTCFQYGDRTLVPRSPRPHTQHWYNQGSGPRLGVQLNLTLSNHSPATCCIYNDHGYLAGTPSINNPKFRECVTDSCCLHPCPNHTARATHCCRCGGRAAPRFPPTRVLACSPTNLPSIQTFVLCNYTPP